MSTQNVKILIRRGLRSEVTTSTLDTAEMAFTTDTNQVFIGTDEATSELQFDSFANAHAVIQTWLDSGANPEPGLVIDEDLVVRNVNDVDALLVAMQSSASFNVSYYARTRNNVEVITENSFNQLFADQHLSIFDGTEGRRSSLFKKTLSDASGTFLSYNKNICSTFFIDYSLVQTNGTTTFVRVGTIKVINGVPHSIEQAKITDDNTEIWQDDSDGVAEVEEFSNIDFAASIDGENLMINFTQQSGWVSEVSYTVKRWSMV